MLEVAAVKRGSGWNKAECRGRMIRAGKGQLLQFGVAGGWVGRGRLTSVLLKSDHDIIKVSLVMRLW